MTAREYREPEALLDGDLREGLATVTITFNPDKETLQNQFDQLPADALKVIVDNASAGDCQAWLRQQYGENPDYLVVQNDRNVGLAAALNQGIRVAAQHHSCPKYVLLLDQDTEPCEGSVAGLLTAYQRLAIEDPSLGCVGPALEDVTTGLLHGFHQLCWYGWRRRFPLPATKSIRVSNINGSGTLVPIAIIDRVGGLNEDLFIDHVDTEWSFRVAASGFSLAAVPSVRFRQRMGETGKRIWLLGWRVWPYRSPTRHFYLFRNTILLVRMHHVPVRWKVPALVKLVITLLGHAALDRKRVEQVRKMLEGVRAGLAAGSPHDWSRPKGP